VQFLSTQPSPLRAHIDSVDAGVVSGWLYNDAAPDQSVDFFLAINGCIVSAGKADQHRSDLLEAGFGNGDHGFNTFLLPGICDKGVTRVSIIDTQYRIIHSKEIALPSFEHACQISCIRKNPNSLEFMCLDNALSSSVEVTLYDFLKMVWSGSVTIAPETRSFEIPIPSHLLDGAHHQFSLGLAGVYSIVWTDLLLTEPLAISCHDKHAPINEFYETGGSRSSQRYKTLALHINHPDSLERIQTIHGAHQILTEGLAETVAQTCLLMPNMVNPSVTVVVNGISQLENLNHLLSSFVMARESLAFEVIVIVPKGVNWLESSHIFSQVRFDYLVDEEHATDRLMRVAQSCSSQYVVFSNGLHEACSGLLSAFCDKLEHSPNTAVVGGKLQNGNGTIYEAGCQFSQELNSVVSGYQANWLDPEYNFVREVDTFISAPFCIRTDNLKQALVEVMPAQNYDTTVLAIFDQLRNIHKSIVYLPTAVGFAKPNAEKQYPKILERVRVLIESRANGHFVASVVKKRILMIDMTTPTPDRDAGSYAAIQELNLISSLGFEVAFLPMDLDFKINYTARLQSLGVEVFHKPFYQQASDVFGGKMANVVGVYITRYNVAEHFVAYLKIHYPHIPIFFNNADLHFLREIRTALSVADDHQLQQALATRTRELAVIDKVDVVLSYTDAEHAVITSHALRNDNLFKCPWVLQPRTTGKQYKERRGIAFLGGFKHLPNVAAMEFFITQVMPLLSVAAPDIILTVYGSHMPDNFKLYASDNVKVIGYVENLDEVYHHCRIFVTPLLTGAGIKGKVLDSLAYGVPTVLSPIAAEGTGLSNGLTTLIAHSPEEWVAAIVKLYNDEVLWHSMSENQKILAGSNYSFENAQTQMRRIFEYAKLL
jgi:glycosyltransferase involved in cell wall biosynthesis